MLKFLAAVAVNIINHTNVNLFRELEIVGIRGRAPTSYGVFTWPEDLPSSEQ